MNSSVPLTDALPWSQAGDGRTFVVCDTLETDGRFLIHTLSAQVLAARSGRVFWIAGGSSTDRLIASALKKMGCDAATAYLRLLTTGENVNDHQLHILSVPVEMSERLSDSEESAFDSELYSKGLLGRVKTWAERDTVDSDSYWIILDDASALAALLGERLTYFFILALRSIVRESGMGLAVRCSNDLDHQDAKDADILGTNQGVIPSISGHNVDWVGIGCKQRDLQDNTIPWERSISELADGIIDVLPLASGYSREAHGRLLFTAPASGNGWGQSHATKKTGEIDNNGTNYCLTDSAVLAIRVRELHRSENRTIR